MILPFDPLLLSLCRGERSFHLYFCNAEITIPITAGLYSAGAEPRTSCVLHNYHPSYILSPAAPFGLILQKGLVMAPCVLRVSSLTVIMLGALNRI